MLTQEEKELICGAACDLETGNHLIRYRSDKERAMIKELSEVLIKQFHQHTLTPREEEILEVYHLCTDYEYAQSKINKQ
jgi:hypothetical protein